MAKPKKKKAAAARQQRRREKTKAKKKAKARSRTRGDSERIRLDPEYMQQIDKAEAAIKEIGGLVDPDDEDMAGYDFAELIVGMDIHKSTDLVAQRIVGWMIREQKKWYDASLTEDIDVNATGDKVVQQVRGYIKDIAQGYTPAHQEQAYNLLGEKVGRLIQAASDAQGAGPIIGPTRELNPSYDMLIPGGFGTLSDSNAHSFRSSLISAVFKLDETYDIKKIDKIVADLQAVKVFEDPEEQAEMSLVIVNELERDILGAVMARLSPVEITGDDPKLNHMVFLNDDGVYEQTEDISYSEMPTPKGRPEMVDMTPEEAALYEQSPAAFLGKKLMEGGHDVHMSPDGLGPDPNNPMDVLASNMSTVAPNISSDLPGATPKSLKDKTVMQYIDLTAVLYGVSRNGNPNQEQRRDASLAWAIMRDARVYSIDFHTYASIWSDSDRYTTEKVAGLDYRPPHAKGSPPEDENKQHADRIMQASKHVGMPDFLPFPNMFIGYGDGIYLTPMQAAVKRLPQGGSHWRTVGHLITQTGHVWEFSRFIAADGSEGVSFDHACIDGRWSMTYDLIPWVVNIIIKLIMSYGTYVVEEDIGKANKRKYKDGRKRMGVKKGQTGYIPPPYYTLRLRSELVKKGISDALPKPPRVISHIRDVSGHTSLRCRRGPLPLDPKLAERMRTPTEKGNHYVIYTVTDPIPEHALAMHNRGLPRKEKGEWVALMFIEKADHKWPKPENRPDLQYIPAARVVPPQEVSILAPGEEEEDE